MSNAAGAEAGGSGDGAMSARLAVTPAVAVAASAGTATGSVAFEGGGPDASAGTRSGGGAGDSARPGLESAAGTDGGGATGSGSGDAGGAPGSSAAKAEAGSLLGVNAAGVGGDVASSSPRSAMNVSNSARGLAGSPLGKISGMDLAKTQRRAHRLPQHRHEHVALQAAVGFLQHELRSQRVLGPDDDHAARNLQPHADMAAPALTRRDAPVPNTERPRRSSSAASGRTHSTS